MRTVHCKTSFWKSCTFVVFLEMFMFFGWQTYVLSTLFFPLLCFPAYVRGSRLDYTTCFGCQVLAFREIQPASFLFTHIFFKDITQIRNYFSNVATVTSATTTTTTCTSLNKQHVVFRHFEIRNYIQNNWCIFCYTLKST